MSFSIKSQPVKSEKVLCDVCNLCVYEFTELPVGWVHELIDFPDQYIYTSKMKIFQIRLFRLSSSGLSIVFYIVEKHF